MSEPSAKAMEVASKVRAAILRIEGTPNNEVIEAVIARAADASGVLDKTCEWRKHTDKVYDVSCEGVMALINLGQVYCHRCGGKITLPDQTDEA